MESRPSGATFSFFRLGETSQKGADVKLIIMTVSQLQEHLHSLEERLLHPDQETAPECLNISASLHRFQRILPSGRIFNLNQLSHALLTTSPRAADEPLLRNSSGRKRRAGHPYHITPANSTSAPLLHLGAAG